MRNNGQQIHVKIAAQDFKKNLQDRRNTAQCGNDNQGDVRTCNSRQDGASASRNIKGKTMAPTIRKS